jgi:hypothetical protein
LSYNLEMIDGLSFSQSSPPEHKVFSRCSKRALTAPSISQLTMRMSLDNQQIRTARSFDIPAIEWKPVARPLLSRDLAFPVRDSADTCRPRVGLFGRSKPLHIDLSHRTELTEC